jgi:hypothetical protein
MAAQTESEKNNNSTYVSSKLLDFMAEEYRNEYGDDEIPEEFRSPINKNKSPYYVDFEMDLTKVPEGTTYVVFNAFDEHTWDDLVNLPDTITHMYLGHDGVIYGTENGVRATLEKLKNLEIVEYCGYYSNPDCDLDDIKDEFNLIDWIPIR